MWRKSVFVISSLVCVLLLEISQFVFAANVVYDVGSSLLEDEDRLDVLDDSKRYAEEQDIASGNNLGIEHEDDSFGDDIDEQEDDSGDSGSAGTGQLDFAMVCTMDGNIHGINAALNRRWTASLGEPTIRTFQRPDTTASGQIVVGEDGSLYIFNSGAAPGDEMRRIQSVSQVVARTPVHQLPVDGDGSNGQGMYIVGKKATKIFQLDTTTGEILAKFSADESSEDEEESAEAQEHPDSKDIVGFESVDKGDNKAEGPLVAIARHDFTVRAYDPTSKEELWNVTYSKFALPSTSLEDPNSGKPLTDRLIAPVGGDSLYSGEELMLQTPWRWDESRVVAAFGTYSTKCDGNCESMFTLVPDQNQLLETPQLRRKVHVQSQSIGDGETQVYASVHRSFVNVNSKYGSPFVTTTMMIDDPGPSGAAGSDDATKVEENAIGQDVVFPHMAKCNEDGTSLFTPQEDQCKVGAEYVVVDTMESNLGDGGSEMAVEESSSSIILLSSKDAIIMVQAYVATTVIAGPLMYLVFFTYRKFRMKNMNSQEADHSKSTASPDLTRTASSTTSTASTSSVTNTVLSTTTSEFPQVNTTEVQTEPPLANGDSVTGSKNTDNNTASMSSLEDDADMKATTPEVETNELRELEAEIEPSHLEQASTEVVTSTSATPVSAGDEKSTEHNTTAENEQLTSTSIMSTNSRRSVMSTTSSIAQSQNESNITETDDVVESDPDVQCVGHLVVNTNRIKGHGCQGTTVFEGSFGGRPVAVKRMLKSFFGSAKKEIDLLIRLDGHPNIVRYFAKEESRDFIYLALELCSTTLDNAMHHHLRDQRSFLERSQKKKKKRGKNRSNHSEDFQGKVYSARLDSTLQFVESMCSAIMHLHQSRIVHLDIKPQNILVVPKSDRHPHGHPIESEIPSDAPHPHPLGASSGKVGLGDLWLPKISDMGLGKRIGDTTSSIRFTAASVMKMQGARDPGMQALDSDGDLCTGDVSSVVGVGTVGWRAPELLGVGLPGSLGGAAAQAAAETAAATEAELKAGADLDEVRLRLSRKVDIFSLGCIVQYVLGNGTHPFGDRIYEREQKIVCANPCGLSHLKDLPEALDLVQRMVSIRSTLRPTIEEVVVHPALWRTSKKLQFMLDLSDRLEPEEPDAPIVQALEEYAGEVIGRRGWLAKLHPTMQAELADNKYRKYNYASLRDLLRVIRNKKSHFRDLGDQSRALLSPMPYGFMDHFCSPDRFPKLVLVCYRHVLRTLAHEREFAHYLGRVVVEKQGPLSQEWAKHAKTISCAGQWYLPELQWVHLDSAQNNARLTKRPQDVVGVVPQYNHKTALCQHWAKSKGLRCPHGAKCIFAHGMVELRLLPKVDGRPSGRPRRGEGSPAQFGEGAHPRRRQSAGRSPPGSPAGPAVMNPLQSPVREGTSAFAALSAGSVDARNRPASFGLLGSARRPPPPGFEAPVDDSQPALKTNSRWK